MLMAREMTQKNNESRLQEQIDANLRRAYEDVLKEDVPERFTQLLAQLKESGASGSGGSDADDS